MHPPPRPPPSRACHPQSKLQLSDGELHLLYRAFKRYLKQGAHISQERQHLQHQLAALLEAQADAAADLPTGGPASQAHTQAQRWLQVRVAPAARRTPPRGKCFPPSLHPPSQAR